MYRIGILTTCLAMFTATRCMLVLKVVLQHPSSRVPDKGASGTSNYITLRGCYEKGCTDPQLLDFPTRCALATRSPVLTYNPGSQLDGRGQHVSEAQVRCVSDGMWPKPETLIEWCNCEARSLKPEPGAEESRHD